MTNPKRGGERDSDTQDGDTIEQDVSTPHGSAIEVPGTGTMVESEILRLGKDEMNLVEHPFSSLSREKDTRSIETHWKTRHPVSKRVLEGYWKVRGDAELGLPTANDEKVYLVGMELTRECNWPREVHFTRADFLRRLGWSDSAAAYRRLHEAFLRLSSMLIEARNAFYHPGSGHYIDGAFHLIDTFMIGGEGPGRKSLERLEKPLTFFVWNKMVHESFIAGNIRSIDLQFALSLERPLSLRLFRYLDKKRYGERRRFEVGLRELCGVHLGMVVEDRYDSNLKASLEGAHGELVARGFLSGVRFEKMKTRKGIKIVYEFVAVPGTVHLLGPGSLPASGSQVAEAPLGLPLGLSPMLPELSGAQQEPPEAQYYATNSKQDSPPASAEQMQLFLPRSLSAPAFPLPAQPSVPLAEAGPASPLLPGVKPLAEAQRLAATSSTSEASEQVSAQASPKQSPEQSHLGMGDGARDEESLVGKLIAVGVAASVAWELCQSFEAGQIELQLDCLADREPKNPAAALVKSIRQAWNPPLAYERRIPRLAPSNAHHDAQEDARESASREGREMQRREQAALKAQAREQAALQQAQQEAEAARLDAAWHEMDAPARQQIEAQARERLGVLGVAGRAPAALNAMRRTLLREREA